MTAERKSLRRRLRTLRMNVPEVRRHTVARAVAAHARRTGLLRANSRVALYLALPEELDTRPLIHAALAVGCRIYVPRIRWRTRRMEFRRLAMDTALQIGRLGISESHGATIATRRLDVVFVPLVGIDSTGTRLGMGAGFYDRHFAFRLAERNWRRPRLIGVAYDFQRVDSIARAPWDVPLDGVLTESGLYGTGDAAGKAWRVRR
jgi:5-formyltetrahydrofolate cyclo-ligase